MTAPSRGTRSRPAISMRRKKTRSAKRSMPTMMRLTITQEYSRSVRAAARAFVSVRGGTQTIGHGGRARSPRQEFLDKAAQFGARVVGDDVEDPRAHVCGQLARGKCVGDDEG